MQYKRSEGFRYVFPNPLIASYKILVNGRAGQIGQPYYNCEIIDISPKGMKLYSEAIFSEHANQIVQLEVHFVLDEVAIQAVGNIVWDKPYAKGKLYGLVFKNQPKLEALIISELKARRRKEVANKKKFTALSK